MFVFLCLTYFTELNTLQVLHVVANSRILGYIELYVCVCVRERVRSHLYLFMWCLRCFHILAVGNNAALNIGEHVSFKMSVFTVFRSGIAGLYGSLFLELLFNWHSHEQCTNVPFAPLLYQYLLFVVFLMRAVLTGVMWLLTLVLIAFSWWLTVWRTSFWFFYFLRFPVFNFIDFCSDF